MVSNVVLYKTYNKNGEVIRHGNKKPEVRKILRTLTNERGEAIIEWTSERGQGVCMPSLWYEWQEGVNEGKRRGKEND